MDRKGGRNGVTCGGQGFQRTICRTIEIGEADGGSIGGLPLEVLNTRVGGALRVLEVPHTRDGGHESLSSGVRGTKEYSAT